MSRPRIEPDESLRNTRRSMGDGTLQGRLRIATPYDPRRLRRATSAITAGNPPVGEFLALTGTVTVAGAGTAVLASMDTVQSQHGFGTVSAAGDVPDLPITASYLAEVDVRWTDGHRDTSVPEVTLNGTVVDSPWPDDGHVWGRWIDQAGFVGTAGDTFDVKVTPSDGAQHDAVVTVRLMVVEPLRIVAQVIESCFDSFATDPVFSTVGVGTGTHQWDSVDESIIGSTERDPDYKRGYFTLCNSGITATAFDIKLDDCFVRAEFSGGFGVHFVGVSTGPAEVENEHSKPAVGFGIYADSGSNHDRCIIGLAMVDATTGFQFVSLADLNNAYPFGDPSTTSSTTVNIRVEVTASDVVLYIDGVAYQSLSDGFTTPDWLGNENTWTHYLSGGLQENQGTSSVGANINGEHEAPSLLVQKVS